MDIWAVKGPRPKERVHASSEALVVETLRAASAGGLAVVPRGGGTQDSWGGRLRRADIHLDLTALTGIVDYEPADLTVTARAGTRLAELQQELAAHGQWLPLDPPLPERATLGGIVAGGASGPWRQLYGGPRDLVIGLRAVLADGTPIRMGGRVVKNVTGFDLGKAFIGSIGSLGVITECSFKVRPKLPAASREATLESPEEAWRAVAAVLSSELVPAALALTGSRLLAAFEEAADYQCRRFAELCGGAEPAGDEAWRSVRAFPLDKPLAVRATVPVAGMPQLLAALAAEGFETLAYPGPGVVWATGGAGQSFAKAASLASAAGGHAIATAGPEESDPWGTSPGELLPLYRNLKARFDPAGLLNPGRFIGGI